MRFSQLTLLLFLAPASVLGLAAQPSYAAEYTFEFISNGFSEFYEALENPFDPNDDVFLTDFTPGPVSLGSGSLFFENDEVIYDDRGFIPFSDLGPSAVFDFDLSIPTKLISTPFVSDEDIVSLVTVYLSEDSFSGFELTAVSEGRNGAVIDTFPGGFSFTGFADNSNQPPFSGGQAQGDGFIQIRKVASEPPTMPEPPTGIPETPTTVPEPTTIMGLIAVFGITAATRRKSSLA